MNHDSNIELSKELQNASLKWKWTIPTRIIQLDHKSLGLFQVRILAHLNFNGTFQATEISITYDVIALWSFLFFILWAWRRATELNFIAGNFAVWILRRPPHHYIGEHPHISWCTRYCLMNVCVCVCEVRDMGLNSTLQLVLPSGLTWSPVYLKCIQLFPGEAQN